MKKHRKETLMRYKKEKLVDYCLMLEHNNAALNANFETQYKNCLRIINDMDILNKQYKDRVVE